MSGKPEELYLDNAAEFKSEALRRGCEEHGIALRYRPPGRPHYGGIVERVIGMLMELVHELPGTTFSNPDQRGRYDSNTKAALTVRELEKWLAVAVASYHGQVHGTTQQTPQARWAAATAQKATITVGSEAAFLVDFLPVIRRTLTRTGFVIDHVRYFSDALKPWIARRDRLDRFVIRRDPRDISRIWVLDPDGGSYLPVPYRTLSHPAVSVWEHRAAVQRLREQGRAQELPQLAKPLSSAAREPPQRRPLSGMEQSCSPAPRAPGRRHLGPKPHGARRGRGGAGAGPGEAEAPARVPGAPPPRSPVPSAAEGADCDCDLPEEGKAWKFRAL